MAKNDEQTNEELARLMGWRPASDTYPEVWNNAAGEAVEMDSPDWCCQSRDAFHTHVVPVLHERGLLPKFGAKVIDLLKLQPSGSGHLNGYHAFALITTPPRTLCEAAIAVMKGQDDETE